MHDKWGSEKRMIKIAICDDQDNIRNSIYKKIKEQQFGEIYEIDMFQTGEDVLQAIEQVQYDIYYLDIELGESGIDGYKLAQAVREKDGSAILIFLSSHDEYACEAYELDVLRFLKKPVVEEKFMEAFRKALKILEKGKKIFTYTVDYKEKFRLLKEIKYFESTGRKIILHMGTGEKEIFYGSIKEVQRQLQENFFVLSHTSYLINLEYVKEIKADQICMLNGEILPMSRRYKKQVKERFTKYVFMINKEAI